MLIINNTTYNHINDNGLELALGRNADWTERFYHYVYNMIYSNRVRSFSSVQVMIRAYLNLVRPNFGLAPLNIQHGWKYRIQLPHRLLSQPVEVVIRMTGSRRDDESAANSVLLRRYGRLQPAGYTWHHVEGIRYHSRYFWCRMCLVDSAQHSAHRHYGAVNEYKWIRAVGYR